MRFTNALLVLSMTATAVFSAPAAIEQSELVARDDSAAASPSPSDTPVASSTSAPVVVVSETPTSTVPAESSITSDAAASPSPTSDVSSSSSSSDVPSSTSEAPSLTSPSPSPVTPSAAPNETELWQDGVLLGYTHPEGDFIVFRPATTAEMSRRALAEDLFPEIPLVDVSAPISDVGADEAGFTLTNADRIKRGLKPRKPARLWSGGTPPVKPAVRARDAQGSSLSCSNSGFAVSTTCKGGNSCVTNASQCTQVSSDPTTGVLQCSAICKSSNDCANSYYGTQNGQCLVVPNPTCCGP